MTGSLDTRIASKKVASETCETSTIIPRSFIAPTTRCPRGVRPRPLPSSPELPPRRFEFDHVSVM